MKKEILTTLGVILFGMFLLFSGYSIGQDDGQKKSDEICRGLLNNKELQCSEKTNNLFLDKEKSLQDYNQLHNMLNRCYNQLTRITGYETGDSNGNRKFIEGSGYPGKCCVEKGKQNE